jgi:hypothetical protein
MRQIFLSLVATVLASTVAVAAEGASSAAPPVAEGSVPSGYVWLSGGVIAIGIGYSWGHGTLYNSKDQKEYKFKSRAFRSLTWVAPALPPRVRSTIWPVRRTSAATIRQSQPASRSSRVVRSPISRTTRA